MVFIKRNADKQVCAICQKDSEPNLEELAPDDPEVTWFLMENSLDKSLKFLISDLDLIRVIEDLIAILMKKNIITITDFPAPVIEKLIDRNKIRGEFQTVSYKIEE
jgi:hypothetical protein